MIQIKLKLGETKFKYSNEELCDYCRFNTPLVSGGAKCLIFEEKLEEIFINNDPDIISYKRLNKCMNSDC